MNDILLYLSLKFSGEWDAILKCIKEQEALDVKDMEKRIKEVKSKFVGLTEENYVDNLKAIFKPPFGIFYYGNYNLLDNQNITVFGNIDENNKQYLDYLRANGLNLLWVDLSNRQMIDVLNHYKTNNIFHMMQLCNDDNKIFNNIIADDFITSNNAFISEVWKSNNEIDYSIQEARMYLGLTHTVLIIGDIKNKQLLVLENYAKKNNLEVIVLEKYFNQKMAKVLKHIKLSVVKKSDELDNILFTSRQ